MFLAKSFGQMPVEPVVFFLPELRSLPEINAFPVDAQEFVQGLLVKSFIVLRDHLEERRDEVGMSRKELG